MKIFETVCWKTNSIDKEGFTQSKYSSVAFPNVGNQWSPGTTGSKTTWVPSQKFGNQWYPGISGSLGSPDPLCRWDDCLGKETWEKCCSMLIWFFETQNYKKNLSIQLFKCKQNHCVWFWVKRQKWQFKTTLRKFFASKIQFVWLLRWQKFLVIFNHSCDCLSIN